MPLDVQAIIGHAWRQGSIFTTDATGILLAERRTHRDSRLILASQDCDIVHRGNGEPFIDTFEVNPIQRLSSTEAKARNARNLHLPVSVDGIALPHQIKFWSRTVLPRERLSEYSPDCRANLEPAGLKWFQQWLGSRYDRPALPDAFNNRLAARNARQEIRAILEPAEHCFDSLYLYIDPSDEELSDGINYSIRVALIISELDAGRPEIVGPAAVAQQALEVFLRSCSGIEIQSVELVTNVDFTLADLDTYRPWDYTDLSLPDP